MPVKLTFVTGNTTKLREVTAILARGPHPIEIEAQDLDIPELQGTTRDIARAKCTRAAELVGGPCITDDTALCFAALGGLPGPYIKPFLPLGPDALVALLAGFECKDAWALCTFAYSAGPGSEPALFEGRTDGTIVPTRGPAHCEWDPCFEPSGTRLTYAEMPAAQKNTTSHRYKALEQLRAYLAGNRCDPYHASSSSSVGAGAVSDGMGEGEVEEGRSG